MMDACAQRCHRTCITSIRRTNKTTETKCPKQRRHDIRSSKHECLHTRHCQMRPTSDAYHTCVTAVTSTKRCHQIQFRHVRRWSQTKRYATDKGKTAMIETGWCVKKAPCPPGFKVANLVPKSRISAGAFFTHYSTVDT